MTGGGLRREHPREAGAPPLEALRLLGRLRRARALRDGAGQRHHGDAAGAGVPRRRTLDRHEMDEVNAHLAQYREHDEDLVELRATGMVLALLDASAQPSPRLRGRVLAAAGTTPLTLPTARDDDDDRDELPDTIDRRPRSRRRFAVPWWFAGVAAALAIAMFGAGWYASLRNAPVAPQTVHYAYEVRGTNGQLVRFAGIEGRARVTVTMDGLPAQPDGRQYQVWAIREGKWVSLAACNTNTKGWWRGDFEFTLQRGDAVALTAEPVGPTSKPSSPAIIRTKL